MTAKRPRKRGPGRPPLGTDARSVVVPVRITAAQHGAIEAAIEGTETTVSGWVRDRISAALERGRGK